MGGILRKSDVKSLAKFVRSCASILGELANFCESCASAEDLGRIGSLLKNIVLKIDEDLMKVRSRQLPRNRGRESRIMWSEEDKEKIRMMYVEEGKTLREIAEQFGVSVVSVWHVLKELGVERRKRGWRSGSLRRSVDGKLRVRKEPSDGLGKELYRMYVEEGKTMREIGDELGVSHTQAWLLLKKYGIPTRSKGRRKCLCVVCGGRR